MMTKRSKAAPGTELVSTVAAETPNAARKVKAQVSRSIVDEY